MKDDKLNKMNEILFNALEALDNDENMKSNAEVEIARCNAMATVSKTIISSVKTKMSIIDMVDRKQTTIEDLSASLGIKINENK